MNNPYYKLIREFHGNDNIAKICSSQSHIDYKDEDLIKIINTYNKCNWINALLFSNSPHIVNSNKTILCYRDYIWKFSSHGRDSNNILISKECKRLLNYILCIRFFIEVHSIVSASRFFHMPTYLRVVIECQSRFFPFFPAFSRNCPDYFLHTSGSSSFRSLSDLGAR